MSNYVRTSDFAAKDGLASGTALKALKGTELGVEFDNIASMSATKVDSASNASLLSLVLTGSTVPSNGIYLPAANTIGLATNNTQRGTINSTGNWSVNAPSSGTALTVTNTSGATIGATFASNDGLGNINIQPNNGGGGYAMSLSTDGTGGKIGTSSSARDLQFQTNSITALKLTSAQVVQATDDGGTFQTVGWRDIPVNSQGANYTLVLADRGKFIFIGTGGGTYTIPANASVAFPIGTSIMLWNNTGTPTTLAITSDTLQQAVSGATGSRTLGVLSMCTIIKVATNLWLINGVGVS